MKACECLRLVKIAIAPKNEPGKKLYRCGECGLLYNPPTIYIPDQSMTAGFQNGFGPQIPPHRGRGGR